MQQKYCLFPLFRYCHDTKASKSRRRFTIDQPVELKAMTAEGSVPVSLGLFVAVDQLGCDVLVGEPAKGDSNIITIPAKK